MSDPADACESQRGDCHNFLQPKIKQRFQVLKKIGSGAYGHVWKVRCKETKIIYAIKKVFLAFQDETDAQRVYREINLLLKIKHENIVKLKQIITAESSNDIYLLFEHLESDVFQAIKNRVLDPTHKKFIVYQLAVALKYLHSAGVVHRDLKPSNILINSSCEVRVCDFGLSRTLKSEFFNKPIMTEFIATRWYRAPQVLMGSKCYSTKSDMWSLGCLIFELYSRRTLLPGQNTIDQITKLLEFKGKPTPEEIQSFKAPRSTEILTYFKFERNELEYYYDDLENEEIKEVLDHLFDYDQNKRWSAEQLLDCEFLREFKGSLAEGNSKTEVSMQLNDNRKYEVDRYKAEILCLLDEKRERPKQRMSSKRLFLSNRGNNKSNYSLHGNLSKYSKPSLQTTIRDKKSHKQYQSAHVSPNLQRSITKMTANARKNILKVAERLSRDLSKRNISNQEEKEPSLKKRGSVLKKPKSKKYIRPEKMQGQLNKQNYEKRLKLLKKERLKHYRNQAQA